jgi:hypothetical protein
MHELFVVLQRSAVPLVKPHNFMHPEDNLILEDESGRVALAGAIPPAAYVTGKFDCHFKTRRSENSILFQM